MWTCERCGAKRMEDENGCGCGCPIEEKKRVAEGSWTIHCYVDCPHCDAFLDIMDEKDSGLDWESVPRPHQDNHDMGLEVTCGECKKEFIVDEITY